MSTRRVRRLLRLLVPCTVASLLVAAPALARCPLRAGGLTANPSTAYKRCGPAAIDYASSRDLAVIRRAVLCLVNAQRRALGVGPVGGDDLLQRAATGHSRDMVAHDYRSHVAPGGSTPYTRVRRVGYDPYYLGEVIWDGTAEQTSPYIVVSAMFADPAHCAVMSSRRFDQVGIGVVAGAPGVGFAPAGAATFTLDFGASIELRRHNPDTGRPVDVTDQTVPVVIGQDMHLDVVVPNGKPPPGPFSWSVGGWSKALVATSAVSNYATPDAGLKSRGVPVELPDPKDWHVDTIDFKFIRSGPFKVEVRTGHGTASAIFDVRRPSAAADPVPATVCDVAENNTITQPNSTGTATVSPPTLGMGLNDVCGHQFGIVWNWSVTAPAGAAGHLAMVQLFTKHVEVQPPLKKCTEYNTFEADGSSFYPTLSGAHEIPIKRAAQLDAHDAPFINLPHVVDLVTFFLKQWHFAFSARDYLMYRSDQPDSIWIPIAELTWEFDAFAKLDALLPKGHWQATVPEQPTLTYSPTVIAPLPDWSRAWGPSKPCS